LFNCIEAEHTAKNALAERKVDLMASGQIEGKNAEQREALLLARTAAERAALREAEAATRLATLKLDEALALSRTYEWMTRAEHNANIRLLDRASKGGGFLSDN
jgi:hypothetical protein